MAHTFRLLLLLGITPALFGQTWQRDEIGFDDVQSRARDLANRPYEAQPQALPNWMSELNHAQYQDIRFNPSQALWATDKLPFRAMFLHPGYLYRDPIVLNEFTSTHQQQIRFAEAYFNYGSLVAKRGAPPVGGGFGGFRLHYQLNYPDIFDELIAFQGANHWRALGQKQRYGLTSRAVAINAGIDGLPEEFPLFREFWLRKPQPGDTEAHIYALLDSPSYTGAYVFRVQPVNETVVDVRAVLFARKTVRRIGFAPMSSMFWFGENSRRRFDDCRPEVHDSDGLLMRMGTGERIWRPLSNDSGKLEFSFFQMAKCNGFGLLQRDRKFSTYQDSEANFHLRPSLWIEPTSDWGPGQVMLMESPTDSEFTENTVAMWIPERTPQAGDRIEFSYRQQWTMDPDPAHSGGRVVATRTGKPHGRANQRTFMVEFTGNRLEEASEIPLVAEIAAVGEGADSIRIHDVSVQSLPEHRWRATFHISPAESDGEQAETMPVELRCCLRRGDDFLTETWVHRVIP